MSIGNWLNIEIMAYSFLKLFLRSSTVFGIPKPKNLSLQWLISATKLLKTIFKYPTITTDPLMNLGSSTSPKTNIHFQVQSGWIIYQSSPLSKTCNTSTLRWVKFKGMSQGPPVVRPPFRYNSGIPWRSWSMGMVWALLMGSLRVRGSQYLGGP